MDAERSKVEAELLAAELAAGTPSDRELLERILEGQDLQLNAVLDVQDTQAEHSQRLEALEKHVKSLAAAVALGL